MNLSERDQRVIWHPFTQHQTASPAIGLVSGEGAILRDENGRDYIDAISSWWTNLFGHAHPQIGARVKQQLDTLEHAIFAGFTHAPAVEVAEKLLGLLPAQQQKVFFSDNGSTSVEVAIKMAIQYWYNLGTPRTTLIAFEGAYHGDTFGAMSVGARGVFNQPFESLLFEVAAVDLPDDDNFDAVMARFRTLIDSGTVAAFIYEPLVQGSAGMRMYKAVHLEAMLRYAREKHVLCIADEVFTGFGRTGKLFASDYLDTKPDIYCISKGITGGFLPLGLTTCTREIYDAFLSDDKLKTLFHGHSYTGNLLACAAATASLDVLAASAPMREDLAARQQAAAARLQAHPQLRNVRQLGTIVAFEVHTAGGGYFHQLRDILYEGCIRRGVLLRPLGNTLYVLPPYCITAEQLDKVYAVIEEVLAELTL